jgi:DNA ligase-3
MYNRACRSISEVLKRCPDGFNAEMKYDGERIQIHKNGDEFQCYSRNLKKIMDWKVKEVREFIPLAMKVNTLKSFEISIYIPFVQNIKQVVLDGEILLMDNKTKKPLPFGTLGIHKKTQFK